jgi:hypothetical protein
MASILGLEHEVDNVHSNARHFVFANEMLMIENAEDIPRNGIYKYNYLDIKRDYALIVSITCSSFLFQTQSPSTAICTIFQHLAQSIMSVNSVPARKFCTDMYDPDHPPSVEYSLSCTPPISTTEGGWMIG